MQLGAQTPFDGTTAERTALTDLTNHRGRLFFETDTKAVYMCDGASWYPVIVDHDHSGDAGDGGVLEIDEALVATGATTGHVLTVQADDSIAAAAAGGGAAVLDYDSASAAAITESTSTIYVDINSMSVSVTVGEGALIDVTSVIELYGSGADVSGGFKLYRSTTALTQEAEHYAVRFQHQVVTLRWIEALAAGTYTYTLRWRKVSGTRLGATGRYMVAIAFTE